MIASIGVAFAGILLFLFIFWKRLKEDYSSEIIFKTAANILIGILIAWALSVRFYPQGFLWLEFFGALAGLGITVYTLRIKSYETFEAFVISILPFVSFVFLLDSVSDSSLISFIAFLITLVFIFIYYYLDVHYKRFTWYKSGKIGFSGLALLIIIFVVRSSIALIGITVLSFLGRGEVYASGVGVLVSLFLLFNLGRQKK